jgi:hypothetical protein
MPPSAACVSKLLTRPSTVAAVLIGTPLHGQVVGYAACSAGFSLRSVQTIRPDTLI